MTFTAQGVQFQNGPPNGLPSVSQAHSCLASSDSIYQNCALKCESILARTLRLQLTQSLIDKLNQLRREFLGIPGTPECLDCIDSTN